MPPPCNTWGGTHTHTHTSHLELVHLPPLKQVNDIVVAQCLLSCASQDATDLRVHVGIGAGILDIGGVHDHLHAAREVSALGEGYQHTAREVCGEGRCVS